MRRLVSLALRWPLVILVLVITVVLAGLLALRQMPRDIFPSLQEPVIYVAQPYGGMTPTQLEGFIVNYYEYLFLYITGIQHVESRIVQGTALIKLKFHAGTNMSKALSETVAYVDRARSFMPPGTVPPFVLEFGASALPVGDLVLSTDNPKITLTTLQDDALFRVRPLLAGLSGVSAPPPFGGSPRSIVIRLDPNRLRMYHLSPIDVVKALSSGNVIQPAGNIWTINSMPAVTVNSVAKNIRTLENLPVRLAGNRTVFIREVGQVLDSADRQVGYALVNGRRSIYIPITKRGGASTLGVVNLVKSNMRRFQAVLPPDVKINYEFDQSPYVTRAIWGLSEESVLGAALTGLMVLIFLWDWRSALIVVLNIPLSILAAAAALWITGQTINIMTLGGIALAVGILVDEATVATENIHTHLAEGQTPALSALLGTTETAAPQFIALLCIVAVFLPTFFMHGVARNLFAPLAMAVGFSMAASYLLATTLVPILSILVLRPVHAATGITGGLFSRFRNLFSRISTVTVRYRWVVIPVYLAATGAVIFLVGTPLPAQIFPTVNGGQFEVRFRAPAGTRIEKTQAVAEKILQVVGNEVGHGDLQSSIGFVGTQPGEYPINNIYLWTAGPQDGVLQIQLRAGSHVSVGKLEDRLRRTLPKAIPHVQLSFEPSDIISRVMSFGSPTPVDVAISGPDRANDLTFANRVRAELAHVRMLHDLQFGQVLGYPAVKVHISRRRAAVAGVTVSQVAAALTEATSSSRYTAANFWADPKNGVGYQVQVELPQAKVNSISEIRNLPIGLTHGRQVQLQAVAKVTLGTIPGEIDRYNMQRMFSLHANISGDDLSRAATLVTRAIRRAGTPPRGVSVAVRGQIETMRELFGELTGGLGVAALAIFLLLAASLQSFRLSLAIILIIPAVLCGVVVILWMSHTTLNIESFMGAIMALGVAMANAVLLVVFAQRGRMRGMKVVDAAVYGATSRVRAILMTSCAMIAGMVPVALAWGQGGGQTAPLGRAVIGGLFGGTTATLLLLPALFAMLQSDSTMKTLSIDPTDENSPAFNPAASALIRGNSGPCSPGAPRTNS